MINLLAAWVTLGGLFGGIIQIMFSMQDTDELSYNTAFSFVSHFYKTYSEEINRAGIIVAIVFISVLIFPGTLLILILATLDKLLSVLWEAFKFVFRERKGIANMIDMEKVKQMNPPYMCGDCLCRVCARNECGDNFAEGIDNDCLGCNGCNGTVDLLEDCPKKAFVPDDECLHCDNCDVNENGLLKEQEAMGWINVKDGLPNENGSYLVVYKAFQYAFVDVKRFAKDLYSVDEYDFPNEHRPGWYEYDDEYGYIERNDITHWMPLPNLPEKGR